MSKFDKLAIGVDTPARLFLNHPITLKPLVDKDGNPAWIDLLSNESTSAQRHERVVTDHRLDARSRGKKISAAEIEADNVDRVVVLTVAWSLVWLDGTPAVDAPFTAENAREIYGLPGLQWIREQVEAWVGTRANFWRPAATS
jgi:hypothetical protein